MTTQRTLNLIVVDGEQLYAERMVDLLSDYYDSVNLGFLDDRQELLKTLRQQWDVLVFGRAYDMSFTDIVGIVQEQNIDLPLICLLNDDSIGSSQNDMGLPKVIDGTMVKALAAQDEAQVVLAVCLAQQNVESRRQIYKLQQVLSEAEQRANILIKNSKSAVAYLDQGIHIFANEPYLKQFGVEQMQDMIGIPIIDLIAQGDEVKAFKNFLRRFEKGNRSDVEFKFNSRRKDGTTFAAKLQLAAATFEGEPVIQVIIQQNNTNAAEIAERLAVVERQDSLTGLENRRGFEHKFALLKSQLASNQISAALLYICLDNIGKINTALGIQGVDEAIKQVAAVLSEMVDTGYVSRFSDSVFTVLFEDMRQAELLNMAEAIRKRIGNLLINVGQRSTTTTVSIGMVMLDSNTAELSVALDRAMSAVNQIMLKSKNEGNAIQLYDASEYASSDDDALAEYLRSAITQSRFRLLYQPIYDINTDRSDLFEVYLRLPLADGKEMFPDEFLPVARRHHLTDKIDRWVLINACKQLTQVRRQHPETRIMVQLSAESLADMQLAKVVQQLQKAVGGSSDSLIIQFNEQDIVDYLAVAKKQYHALQKINCPMNVRNFGLSAKTLDILNYVHPKMVRLSKNYLDNLDYGDNLETVKTLVAKAKEHHADALMPYIEDAATMSVAWSVGARYLQGYYLQEPSESMVFASQEN